MPKNSVVDMGNVSRVPEVTVCTKGYSDTNEQASQSFYTGSKSWEGLEC